MTTYRAVVKYALDASADEKRKALKQGISECALELYCEHCVTLDEIERVFEDAYSDVQLEEQRVKQAIDDLPKIDEDEWVKYFVANLKRNVPPANGTDEELEKFARKMFKIAQDCG